MGIVCRNGEIERIKKEGLNEYALNIKLNKQNKRRASKWLDHSERINKNRIAKSGSERKVSRLRHRKRSKKSWLNGVYKILKKRETRSLNSKTMLMFY